MYLLSFPTRRSSDLRRRQIDGDDLVPLLDGKFLDRRDVLDAGIVDQNIDAPERLLGGLDHGGDLGRLGHVRSEEHTSELQSLRHLVCRLLLEKNKS